MKPTQFNPSPLEVEFARTIVDMKEELVSKLTNMKLDEVQTALKEDNPYLVFKLTETDGTKHEIMVKFIQRVLED